MPVEPNARSCSTPNGGTTTFPALSRFRIADRCVLITPRLTTRCRSAVAEFAISVVHYNLRNGPGLPPMQRRHLIEHAPFSHSSQPIDDYFPDLAEPICFVIQEITNDNTSNDNITQRTVSIPKPFWPCAMNITSSIPINERTKTRTFLTLASFERGAVKHGSTPCLLGFYRHASKPRPAHSSSLSSDHGSFRLPQ